jgi:class 3 adenylate cyclase
VLTLEGALIFRPAVRKLQQSITALGNSLQETQATAKKLAAEQQRSERLLLNILPEPIADRLKQKPQAIADGFAEATVLFADVVGFTEMSNHMSPTEIVSRLNQIFSRFDALAEEHGLEKIKTIGDAYMVVGGLPNPRTDHAEAIADMALDMQQAIEQLNWETGESFSMRIGINTGPVVAGVIGTKKFIYDLWGDTVNVASRMESQGMPGQIQVTETTYRRLQGTHQFEERGIIQIKGKGNMKTYWLKQRAEELVRV